MISRVQELCRNLKPVLGKKIDRLWSVYLAESDPGGIPSPAPSPERLPSDTDKLGDFPGEEILYSIDPD